MKESGIGRENGLEAYLACGFILEDSHYRVFTRLII